VVPRIGLDHLGRRKILPLPAFELRPLVGPVRSSRCTNYALPVSHASYDLYSETVSEFTVGKQRISSESFKMNSQKELNPGLLNKD
jgi:hypothetical protein